MTNPPVLLVEDNPNDEALMLRAFKKGGFVNDVVVARDGAEALAYLLPADEAGRLGGELTLLPRGRAHVHSVCSPARRRALGTPAVPSCSPPRARDPCPSLVAPPSSLGRRSCVQDRGARFGSQGTSSLLTSAGRLRVSARGRLLRVLRLVTEW